MSYSTTSSGAHDPMASKTFLVRCTECGDVGVSADGMIVDPDEECYRFTCPRCNTVRERVMDYKVETMLLSNGARTIEQICKAEAGELDDDRAFWKAMLK